MENNALPRLDEDDTLRPILLRHCRLKPGEIWTDPVSGHKVGCIDATNSTNIGKMMNGEM